MDSSESIVQGLQDEIERLEQLVISVKMDLSEARGLVEDWEAIALTARAKGDAAEAKLSKILTIDSVRVDPPMPITLEDIPTEAPAVIAIYRDNDGMPYWEYLQLDGQEGTGWSSGDLGFEQRSWEGEDIVKQDLVAYINEHAIVWRILR